MEYPSPDSIEETGRILESLDDFWAHWGFEPWRAEPFAGVSRVQRFVKDGFLGPIAEYGAWDCIVWASGTEEDRERLWKSIRPLPEIMTQRFVFLLDRPWAGRRIRSFTLGFKGYAEFYAYRPNCFGEPGRAEVKDLTALVDMGLSLGGADRAARTGNLKNAVKNQDKPSCRMV